MESGTICEVVGIGTVHIKMHDVVRMLIDV